MHPAYRSILPARPRTQSPQREGNDPPKRQRITCHNACQNCRSRKVGCDGAQPSCTECIKRETKCIYQEPRTMRNLQRDLKGYAEIMECLRTGSAEEVAELLRRLKSAADPLTVLPSIKEGMQGGQQATGSKSPPGASPAKYSHLEFELGALHPLAYPPLPPLDVTAVSSLLKHISHLSRIHGDVLNELGQSPSMPSSTLSTDISRLTRGILSSASSSTNAPPAVNEEVDSPQPQQYCDERLSKLEIGYWTTVPISNEEAASALSLYLEQSHSIYGFFDADVFLDDLIHHELEFCSAFLVNALLAYACQSYTATDLRFSTFGSAFLEHAESLWRAERWSVALVNVAAINLLALACHTAISDISMKDLLSDGRRVSERLFLFNTEHNNSTRAMVGEFTSKRKKATAHIAWGSYNWLTLNTFYCELEPIAFPPSFPIPGIDGHNAMTGWPAHPLPAYMGSTFGTLCKLWSIMQEVAQVYFAQRPPSALLFQSKVPLAFAESKYQKLLSWSDTVNTDMSRGIHNTDHVVILHILFHCAVCDIFRPFVQEQQTNTLRSFSSPNNSTVAVMRATMNQLCRLVVECRLNHPKIFYSTVASAGTLHLCNLLLSDHAGLAPSKAIEDHDINWQFYFLLCLANVGDFYVCFPVYDLISSGVLAMAMRKGVLSGREAHMLLLSMRARVQHHPNRTSKTAGSFFLDFDLAITAPAEALAVAVAKDFDELAMFDDLTTGNFEMSTDDDESVDMPDS